MAAENGGKRNENGVLAEIYDWVEAAVFALVVVVLMFTFIFRIVWVDGQSMEPTLSDGDRVIISHLFYKPRIGDIVVITQPNAFNKPLIKRIIALSGQTVSIDYASSKVYVDGVALDEPYVSEAMEPRGDISFPYTVPQGFVFVMGDNRNNSGDSRYSSIGPVDERYILGRVVFRVYPFDGIGKMD